MRSQTTKDILITIRKLIDREDPKTLKNYLDTIHTHNPKQLERILSQEDPSNFRCSCYMQNFTHNPLQYAAVKYHKNKNPTNTKIINTLIHYGARVTPHNTGSRLNEFITSSKGKNATITYIAAMCGIITLIHHPENQYSTHQLTLLLTAIILSMLLIMYANQLSKKNRKKTAPFFQYLQEQSDINREKHPLTHELILSPYAPNKNHIQSEKDKIDTVYQFHLSKKKTTIRKLTQYSHFQRNKDVNTQIRNALKYRFGLPKSDSHYMSY